MSSPAADRQHHARGVRGPLAAGWRYRDRAQDRSPRDPSVCTDCHAVYRDGVWRWMSRSAASVASSTRCPACQRLRDNDPAGYVRVQGPFFTAHRDELLELIDRVTQTAAATHPLDRLMSLEELPEGGVALRTTDVHLAQCIGHSLQRTYPGELRFLRSQDGQILRVRWRR